MIEALTRQIERFLLAQNQPVSEYQLIKHLKQSGALTELGLTDSGQLDLQNSHVLFRLHFMVFHCLYLLRDQWLRQGKALLNIDSLKITVQDYLSQASQSLAEADPLRDYYLDFGHFEQTTAEQADELIDSFWQKFVAQADRFKALAVLELDESASYDEVKTQYRKLAMERHPDRGGEADKLAEINRAMDTLKRYYR